MANESPSEPPVPIPDFIDNVLPEGVWDCTLDEVVERFGRFQKSERRIKLTDKLELYLKALRSANTDANGEPEQFISAVIIDGSYVTAKDEPDDIDLLIVLDPNFDFTQELKMYRENVIDKKAIKRDYKFDGFAHVDGTPGMLKLIEDWSKVMPDKYSSITTQTRKGMVRIKL